MLNVRQIAFLKAEKEKHEKNVVAIDEKIEVVAKDLYDEKEAECVIINALQTEIEKAEAEAEKEDCVVCDDEEVKAEETEAEDTEAEEIEVEDTETEEATAEEEVIGAEMVGEPTGGIYD